MKGRCDMVRVAPSNGLMPNDRWVPRIGEAAECLIEADKSARKEIIFPFHDGDKQNALHIRGEDGCISLLNGIRIGTIVRTSLLRKFPMERNFPPMQACWRIRTMGPLQMNLCEFTDIAKICI